MENQKEASVESEDCELEDLSLIVTNTFETEDFDATEELISKCSSIHACKVCDEVFRTKKDLLKHMADSYDCRTKKIFRCIECQHIFRTIGEFQLHLLSHSQETEEPKKQSESDASLVLCELCGKDFVSLSLKKKHIESHFERRGSILCPTCGKCLCSKEMYLRHRHVHGFSNQDKSDEGKKKKFQCKICNKSFNVNSALRDHLYIHTGKKNFECTFCKKHFATKGTLRAHIKLHFKSSGNVNNVQEKKLELKIVN